MFSATLPALSEASDPALVTLAKAGDRAAFSQLVQRHGGAVRALLRRMGAAHSLADDLAQDAFVAAWRAIGGYRGEGGFAAWVRKIAARLYVRRARRDARYDWMAEPPEPEALGLAEQARADLRLDLDAALQALPPVQRLCVSLCHGADLTQAEAAEALGLPLGTVKSHVKRGLEKLKLLLAPQGPLGDRSRTYG